MNEATGALRQVATDVSGIYAGVELPVSYYTVRFESSGFSSVERKRVKVDVGGETHVDIRLSIQPLDQSIEVNAVVPVLQQDASSLAEVVETRQAQVLQLSGRDFRKLAFLTPGDTPLSPRRSLGSFAVNGQREKSNICLIDDVDNNDSFRNQPSFNQGGVTGAPATLFPVDGLAEFSVGESSNDRPDVVGDLNDGPKRRDAWFNTAAFAPAPTGTFGNSGRKQCDRTPDQRRRLFGVEIDIDHRTNEVCSSGLSSSIFQSPEFCSGECGSEQRSVRFYREHRGCRKGQSAWRRRPTATAVSHEVGLFSLTCVWTRELSL